MMEASCDRAAQKAPVVKSILNPSGFLSGIRTRLKQAAKTLMAHWLMLLLPSFLLAHPHVFMDTKVDFQFDQQGLNGFWIEWHFDEFFTSGILFDFDGDKDNTFSPQEIQEIESSAFSNLRKFDYFTYTIVQGEKKAVNSVTDFHAEIRENRLVYRFYVPFSLPSDGQLRQVKIAAYDKDFYCDIAFRKNEAVVLLGAETFETSFQVQKNEELTINYDNTYQTATRENASYSGVTNPYEIILSFRSGN